MESNKLDRNRIHALLGSAPPEVKQQVNAKVQSTLDALQVRLNHDVPFPNILYNLKGRTGAWAIGSHTIRINSEILNNPKHTQDVINQTVPHEVCHLVQSKLYPNSKAHGNEWQYLMHLIGLTPERCHNYDTTPQRKTKKYKFLCPSCGGSIIVGTNVYNKIKSGQTRMCGNCGSPFKIKE